MRKPYAIGIAFSGGGARGIAHIGVLKTLEQHGIFPSCVAGASAGSIVGALYANGVTPDSMLAQVKKMGIAQAAKFKRPRGGLLHTDFIKDILLKNIPQDDFSALPKPLFVCVTNANTGKSEVIAQGKISDAVMASSAIPLVFNPIHINNQIYIDGGLTNNLPADVLRPICDLVIGVNIVPMMDVSNDELLSFKDMGLRTFEIAIWQNTQHALPYCDVVIDVKTLRKINILNVGNADEIYQWGCEAALEKIAEMNEEMKNEEMKK
jgi:NTE family protein